MPLTLTEPGFPAVSDTGRRSAGISRASLTASAAAAPAAFRYATANHAPPLSSRSSASRLATHLPPTFRTDLIWPRLKMWWACRVVRPITLAISSTPQARVGRIRLSRVLLFCSSHSARPSFRGRLGGAVTSGVGLASISRRRELRSRRFPF